MDFTFEWLYKAETRSSISTAERLAKYTGLTRADD